MSIVVVGSVAFDTIETPFGSAERAIGGSATYFSIAASYFSHVRLVAVVGEDFSDEYRAAFLSKGIDLEGLEVVAGGKTFYWHGRYGKDPNERESLATELNVFEAFRPILPASYRDSEYLFLGNIDPDIQIEVLNQMEDAPFVGCDTMNFWIEGKTESLRRLLGRVDILFINDEEARMLSGERNLVKAAGAVLGMGPSAVVVKKGEHGAFLFTREFTFFAPAYPLAEVTDPTGAGDSFAGGFMGYLAGAPQRNGRHLRRAMLCGTVTASFTCGSFSIERLKDIAEQDLDDRFRTLVDLVSLGEE
ncbi:MAG TPA: PfkB family carbohydrate kinase [Patescibacteria group bacterium]|nr:PfkB family carbohydrate kinase [Patescibacteria group bacterium]